LKRVCVDMDEVMADTLAEHLRRYNQAFEDDVTVDDLAGKGLWEITPQDRQKELRAFLDAEDFFEDLPLMPDSQEVLKQLSSRFEIFIATQAMAVPNSLGPKYRWLQRHFPFIPPRIMSSAATRAFCAPITWSTICRRICCALKGRDCCTRRRTT
jgi:5'-nucleotidase